MVYSSGSERTFRIAPSKEVVVVAVSSSAVEAVPWAPPRVDGRSGRLVVAPAERLPASTYRRRRAVAAGLVVALVLGVCAALGMFGGGPLPAPDRPAELRSGITYVVQPGDTLWSIAERLDPDGDPRPVVDRLARARGGPVLHVGERLRLPAS